MPQTPCPWQTHKVHHTTTVKPASNPVALRSCALKTCAAQELSSLLVSPDHYVERRVVTSRTGEESVLTFSLRQANADSKHSASGASSGRDPWGGSSGQHQGRGIHGYDEGDGSAWLADHADLAPMGFVMDSGMVGQDPGGSGAGGSSHRWKLTRVRGEPLHASLPEQPSPEWAPEAVVAAQLEYLQRGQFGQVRLGWCVCMPVAVALLCCLHRLPSGSRPGGSLAAQVLLCCWWSLGVVRHVKRVV